MDRGDVADGLGGDLVVIRHMSQKVSYCELVLVCYCRVFRLEILFFFQCSIGGVPIGISGFPTTYVCAPAPKNYVDHQYYFDV